MAQGHAETGMDGREESAGNSVAKEGKEHPAAHVPAAETLTVGQVEGFTANLCQERFMMHRYSALIGQVTLHPHIVVTCKDMDIDTPVRERGEGAQETDESFRDHSCIFPPEIKEIT
jgi:hypothetical protein